MNKYGYNPLIVDLPTKVNKFTETCILCILIDNIYTNYNNYLENCQSGILRTTFSDHYSIVAISKFSSITKQTSFISRREFTGGKNTDFVKKTTTPKLGIHI